MGVSFELVECVVCGGQHLMWKGRPSRFAIELGRYRGVHDYCLRRWPGLLDSWWGLRLV